MHVVLSEILPWTGSLDFAHVVLGGNAARLYRIPLPASVRSPVAAAGA